MTKRIHIDDEDEKDSSGENEVADDGQKQEQEEDAEMPIPVVLKNLEDDLEPFEDETTRVIRREQINLDKIMEGAGTKFYVTGDTVKIGAKEFLDLSEKHDMDQVLHLEKEEIVISSKLLAGIARADVIEEEEEELQYIDAAAVGLFIAGFIGGLVGIFVSKIAYVHTASWVIFFVSMAMLISYVYQGIRTGFIKRLWKKYLAKMAKYE